MQKLERKAATPSCNEVSTITPQRQQVAASATDSSGLIFVSTEPRPLSSVGLAEIQPVLNSFFCAGTINNDGDDEANDGGCEGIKRQSSVQSKKPATPAPTESPIDAVEPKIAVSEKSEEKEEEEDVEEKDVYERNPIQLTFMQKKLLRLQQEHLSAFAGSSLGEIAKPKLSKLEQERDAALQKKKAAEAAASLEETTTKKQQGNAWQSMSFDDAFASAKPRKSRLEREKELAELCKAKLQAEGAAAAEENNNRYTRVEKKSAKVVADDAVWGNVLKKRSRLEMEKEKAQAKAKAEADDGEDQEETGVMSKRRKIEQANDYWKQFGNGDIFGQVVKKKSKLEQEKENAQKARIKESEKQLKTEGNKKKGIVLMI